MLARALLEPLVGASIEPTTTLQLQEDVVAKGGLAKLDIPSQEKDLLKG